MRRSCPTPPRSRAKWICSWSSAATARCCTPRGRSPVPTRPCSASTSAASAFSPPFRPTELADALKLLWQGEFKFESRALIEATGTGHGKKIKAPALNDIVISRGAASRLIALDVSVNGEPITRYRCDGLIVSSPTGSTAYSLAAGGAIVLPTAEVFALTPICPHALSNRSIILPLSATIRVKAVKTEPATFLNADGQIVGELDERRRNHHPPQPQHRAAGASGGRLVSRSPAPQAALARNVFLKVKMKNEKLKIECGAHACCTAASFCIFTFFIFNCHMVRLKDIAQLAGVSVMTVSKALRDEPDVSAATKAKIK